MLFLLSSTLETYTDPYVDYCIDNHMASCSCFGVVCSNLIDEFFNLSIINEKDKEYLKWHLT